MPFSLQCIQNLSSILLVIKGKRRAGIGSNYFRQGGQMLFFRISECVVFKYEVHDRCQQQGNTAGDKYELPEFCLKRLCFIIHKYIFDHGSLTGNKYSGQEDLPVF